jgi:hypothetical protein
LAHCAPPEKGPPGFARASLFPRAPPKHGQLLIKLIPDFFRAIDDVRFFIFPDIIAIVEATPVFKTVFIGKYGGKIFQVKAFAEEIAEPLLVNSRTTLLKIYGN